MFFEYRYASFTSYLLDNNILTRIRFPPGVSIADILLGFGDTLCCFSHMLTAHPPKISGTTPVINMKMCL
jgi:hypothetical protein